MSETAQPAPTPPPNAVPPLGLPAAGRAPVPPAGPAGVPNSGLAIASLVLGIASFLCCMGALTAIPGLITGHMARSEIQKSGGRIGGDGMALTGLILGYLTLALTIIGTILFFAFGLLAAATGAQVPAPH